MVISCKSYGFAKEKDSKIEIGTAKVRIEIDKSEALTKIEAEEQAKIEAIANAFGTSIEARSETEIASGKSSFRYIGTTKVKGEWVEELRKPEFKKEVDDKGNQYIICTVKGRVKRATPKADFEFSLLSCPKLECRKISFYSGEQLFLYFKSPINGYLNIYQGCNDTIYRLLPYVSEQDSSSVKIKADKEYFLFTKSQSYPEIGKHVDEIELQTSEKLEINRLYIIFSEKNYKKPILKPLRDDKNGYLFPRSLGKDDFEEWLSKNRATLDDFLDRTADLTISSKN